MSTSSCIHWERHQHFWWFCCWGKSGKLYEQSDPAAALTLNRVLAPTCNNVPLLNHFLVLDSTLLSSMPMTSLSRRLFLAGVERSGSVVLPGLVGCRADLASVSTSDRGAGLQRSRRGHRGCLCLFKAMACRWTTDQISQSCAQNINNSETLKFDCI